MLGHELGHVENRDAMTALLRDFGIGLLIGGADGGKLARALLASRYGRSAERAADAHAIAALARADVSPADTAAFFDRLAKDEGGTGRMAGRRDLAASGAAPRGGSDPSVLFRSEVLAQDW